MEEAESKAVALERVADLEDELGRVNERLQELEVKCSVLAAPLVSLMPTLPIVVVFDVVVASTRWVQQSSHCPLSSVPLLINLSNVDIFSSQKA